MTPEQAREIALLIEHAEIEAGTCRHNPDFDTPEQCRRCQARRKLARTIVAERDEGDDYVTGWYVTRLDRDNDGYPTSEPWDDRIFLTKATARAEADKLQATAEASQRAKYDQQKKSAERAIEEHNTLVNAGLRQGRRSMANSYPEFKPTLQFDISDVEVHP